MKKDLLSNEIIYLIKIEPFTAHLLQNTRRIITKQIDTLGVNITDKINLYINPDFIKSINDPKQRVALLKHEILHIISKHPLRRNNRDAYIWNISCDIAINVYLPNIPEGAMLPKKFDLPEFLEAEEYYKRLMKEREKVQKIASSLSLTGDHNIWEKSDKKSGEAKISKDVQIEVVKNAIKKSLETTKDYGSLPGKIREELNKTLFHKTLNWRLQLQRFLYRGTIVNRLPTKKRPNRRFGYRFDGFKTHLKLDLLIGVDTSGSISSDELDKFFSEIDKIKSLGMKIMVAECDTQINKKYIYKRRPNVTTGRGGTMFQPIFDLAQRIKPNAIVYLTDLFASLNFKKSHIPTLWVITRNGREIKDVPFGKGIKMKED